LLAGVGVPGKAIKTSRLVEAAERLAEGKKLDMLSWNKRPSQDGSRTCNALTAGDRKDRNAFKSQAFAQASSQRVFLQPSGKSAVGGTKSMRALHDQDAQDSKSMTSTQPTKAAFGAVSSKRSEQTGDSKSSILHIQVKRQKSNLQARSTLSLKQQQAITKSSESIPTNAYSKDRTKKTSLHALNTQVLHETARRSGNHQ